jgi:glycosyltransferase involved in cell wall biosynthesis
MKTIPKLSYIIATRNRSDVIRDTIDSLINQTEEAWQAIIINDHGTDNTEAIVGDYHDDRLVYIKLGDSNGRGASCARNIGAIWAEAPIVAITDSDDILYPNRTSETVKAFLSNPDIDVFYSDFDIWDEASGEIRSRKTPVTDYSFEKIKADHFIPHVTVAMRKQLLLDNPYNQYFRMAEDYELLTRFAVQGKHFYFCNKKLMKYRLGVNNMSCGKKKEEIVGLYGQMVKMVRGFIPFDPQVAKQIQEIDK